ncbi:hypothetical protein [Vibrio parahaemolyticus]|uniref:hypothetical protein n=1 Tax=Vibrio parahaemolyticus TaxID=670 RepID=UPI0024924D57|nr:hypothetical protein [Vibrio parahaemolyticus]
MTKAPLGKTLKSSRKNQYLIQVSQRKHCNSHDKENALSTPKRLFVKTNFKSRVSANKSTFQNTETSSDLSQQNQ